MRKFAAALVCLSLAAAASAGPISFYFSLSNNVAAVPDEWTNETTLTVNSGEVVYLWAATLYPDIWNGVGMQFGSDAATFDVTSGVMYNPEITGKGGWGPRWETGSDFDPVADNLITLVGVTSAGLGDDLDPYNLYETVGSDYVYHNLLGEIDFSAFEGLSEIVPVYLETSGGGISLRGGTQSEEVFFGFGDGAIINSAPKGTRSALPDIFVHSDIPEPASLLLLGLAGLVLRRR